MNYQETLDFLFNQLPVFEAQGAHAYKPGLERMEAMSQILGNPHQKFRTIHIAGTNGKGTCSHTLASILQGTDIVDANGQTRKRKVGLFTSPHLLDFSERIRINGEPIRHDYVVTWVEKWYECLKPQLPSFFELATAMAFSYFADEEVDVAVIEVGLGGRLDSTNIIHPDLTVITNISMDHMQYLGNTLPQIAAEKAGIMKAGVPCVIGECPTTGSAEQVQQYDRVRFTFQQNAQLRQVSELDIASDKPQVIWVEHPDFQNPLQTPHYLYHTLSDGDIASPLLGTCQPHNANTILTAVHQLRTLGYAISEQQLHEGFAEVLTRTHLRGRWEILQNRSVEKNLPQIICDTGHNEGCFQYLGPQLKQLVAQDRKLHIVFGMVSDKEVGTVLTYLPKSFECQKAGESQGTNEKRTKLDGSGMVEYYFCNAPTPRALPAAELQQMAIQEGLSGDTYPSAMAAYEAALSNATCNDTIFVGGSNFIVCEILALFQS